MARFSIRRILESTIVDAGPGIEALASSKAPGTWEYVLVLT